MMSSGNYFKAAPVSGQIKMLSAFGIFVLLGGAWIFYAAIQEKLSSGTALALITCQCALVIGLLIWSIASIIKGYEVTAERVMVVRLFGRKEIISSPIVSVKLDPAGMDKSVRKLGIGGIFSITGLFYNATLGDFQAYVTDASKAVVIKTEDHTVVVSPEMESAFVTCLCE
jgi:Bacterial PH domain